MENIMETYIYIYISVSVDVYICAYVRVHVFVYVYGYAYCMCIYIIYGGNKSTNNTGKHANQRCHQPTMQWEHQPGGYDMRT